MKRFLSTILLGSVLSAPAALVLSPTLSAQAPPPPPRRYYDPYGHDYHRWDAREERAYHQYWAERHLEYREWARVRRPERVEYWRWRHSHPDAVIVVRP